MLVLLSDLHISDESTDKNFSPDAFKILRNEIETNAGLSAGADAASQENKVKEIRIVLLGDIFDLVRTDYWLQKDIKRENRPWGGTLDPNTGMNNKVDVIKKQFIEILDNIIVTPCAKGLQSTIQHLADEAGKKGIYFKVSYVIGNHDRVLHNFDSLKIKISDFLLKQQSQSRVLEFIEMIADEDYGVLARHGHEWSGECYPLDVYNEVLNKDKPNVGRFDKRLDKVMAIGEVITAELMAGFIWRLKGQIDEPERQKLMAVHTVRPFSSAFLWIDWFMSNRVNAGFQTKIIKALHDSLDDLLESSLAKEYDKITTFFPPFNTGDITDKLNILRGIFADKSKKWYAIIKAAVPLLNTLGLLKDDDENFVAGAKSDFTMYSNKKINYVVYGHTHLALQHYLEGEVTGAHKTYINTGTYLPLTQKGETNGFVVNYQMTLLAFYRKDEDMNGKVPDTNSMDLWNGVKRKIYK